MSTSKTTHPGPRYWASRVFVVLVGVWLSFLIGGFLLMLMVAFAAGDASMIAVAYVP